MTAYVLERAEALANRWFDVVAHQVVYSTVICLVVLILTRPLRGRLPHLHFWLWALTVLGAFSVIYWRVAEGQLDGRKAQVMSKQRAIAKTIGPKILPFRDKVETWARELAGPYPR